MTQEETALVIHEEQAVSLLTGAPKERVQQATEIANALSPVIEQQKLFATISGRGHVLYEGLDPKEAVLRLMTREAKQED